MAKSVTVDDIFKDSEVLNYLNTKIESQTHPHIQILNQNPSTKQNVDSTDAELTFYEPKISTFVLQMKKQNNIIKAQ